MEWNVEWNVEGNVEGDVEGDVEWNVEWNLEGTVEGDVEGDVQWNVEWNLEGTVEGMVCGTCCAGKRMFCGVSLGHIGRVPEERSCSCADCWWLFGVECLILHGGMSESEHYHRS